VSHGSAGTSACPASKNEVRARTRSYCAYGKLILAAASWVVVVRQMNGMDMAAATELGSLAGFIGYPVPVGLAIVAVGITATADL
jgi:hypothetical protein